MQIFGKRCAEETLPTCERFSIIRCGNQGLYEEDVDPSGEAESAFHCRSVGSDGGVVGVRMSRCSQ